MPEALNPPSLVRQAEDFETCLSNAQSHAARIVKDVVAAGEWLIKAKAACPHGQWLPALQKYGFTPRTAQRLMEAARRKGEIRHVSHLFDMDPGTGLADLTDEELVALAKESRRKAEEAEISSSPDRWAQADHYAELARMGWSKQRIANHCGVQRSEASVFIRCSNRYPAGGQRPSFRQAYMEPKRRSGRAIDDHA